jgi:20S proteasome alpha/beta subunit
LGNNILDAPSRIGHPFQKLKKRKTPVTLIIGIVCKDGIVLAADSQTTKGISFGAAKSCSTDKINVIEFENGKALVAESGSASLSNSVIEAMHRKAKGVKIENELTIAKLAEDSVREIRSSITNLHPTNTAPENWQDFFSRDINYFELMIAYYFDQTPCLYTLNPLWCIPIKVTSYFDTSGIASDLANYILKEHTEPKMDSEFASVIAVKVIEDAIEYVEGCGSPTKVAIIKPPMPQPDLLQVISPSQPFYPPLLPNYQQMTSEVAVFPQEKVNKIAEIISRVEKQIKINQTIKIHDALRKQTLKTLEEIWEDVMPAMSKKKKKKKK